MVFVVATNNKKKLKEVERILNRLGHEAISLSQAGINVEVEETGTTFEENALIKAKTIAKLCGKATISDDSGLEVDALAGKPGVYTARYAGENATDDENIDKLLKALENVPKEKRSARFVSCMCLYLPAVEGEKEENIICRGQCEGWIAFERLGFDGFGYDPVFMVENESFATLSPLQKDAISHRGKAMEKLEKEIEKIFGEKIAF